MLKIEAPQLECSLFSLLTSQPNNINRKLNKNPPPQQTAQFKAQTWNNNSFYNK